METKKHFIPQHSLQFVLLLIFTGYSFNTGLTVFVKLPKTPSGGFFETLFWLEKDDKSKMAERNAEVWIMTKIIFFFIVTMVK